MHKLNLKLAFLNLLKRRNSLAFSLLGLTVAFATTNLGFEKENVMMLTLNKTICSPKSVESLKQELLRNPDIESVAFASNSPGEVLGSKPFQIDRDEKKVKKIVNVMSNYDYIPLMKVEIAEGINFHTTHSDDNF